MTNLLTSFIEFCTTKSPPNLCFNALLMLFFFSINLLGNFDDYSERRHKLDIFDNYMYIKIDQ